MPTVAALIALDERFGRTFAVVEHVCDDRADELTSILERPDR